MLIYFRYKFRLLDKSGWNFRHPHYHEEGRRTLYKAFGIKFLIIVNGMAGTQALSTHQNFIYFLFSGKFSLKNTVMAIFAGLGLLTFVTMVCDLILLNYISEKQVVCKIS